MSYSNLKIEDPTLVKKTTNDDEIKELKNKSEKHDFENVLKSPKFDNVQYRKN